MVRCPAPALGFDARRLAVPFPWRAGRFRPARGSANGLAGRAGDDHPVDRRRAGRIAREMSLLLSADALAARRSVADGSLAALASSLTGDLAAVIDRAIYVPSEKAMLSREG